ncbi:hypothetical protein B0A52_01501 [Exophiala mesophila]|uniref:Amine oxidase n=1 Tax=Exophiala mesophila TaxID=212818 RepID=A0A438NF65_EXOME|nr:hypothetical protein B0A52_01501 [Exophiala mesophila]
MSGDTVTYTADVVVVGAGLSGLVAAAKLTEKKISCIVLEARDRVGGKTYSKPVLSGGSSTEAGAAWINEHTQPHIYKLVQRFGLDTVTQYAQGIDILSDRSGIIHTSPTGASFLEALDKDGSILNIMQELSAQSSKVDLYNIKQGNANFEDMPLSEWLEKQGLKRGTDEWAFFRAFVAALLGVEPDEISTLYWFDYIKSGLGLESLGSDGPEGAQYRRVRQGNQTVSIRLAQELAPDSLRLNSPVRSIEQQYDGFVLVTTYGDRKFRAKKVIISVPTPLYRSISFSPPLPAEKAEYVNSTFNGDYAKVSLIYSEPWWRNLGLSGIFTDLNGPVCFSRDTSFEQDKQYSITCFVVGEICRQWAKLSTTQRKDTILDSLTRMVGEKGARFVRTYLDVRETNWMPEIWSLGAPCPVPGPGTWLRLGDSLRTPFQNLHFVGTETAFIWKGYMDGAVSAGERGAQEVIEALSTMARL